MRKLTVCGVDIADFTIVIPTALDAVTIPLPAEKSAVVSLHSN